MTRADLDSLKELHRERRSILDRIEMLRATVERTSPNLDGMPHGGQQRDLMAEYAANYDAALRRLSGIEKRISERIDEVEKGIRDANLPARETAIIWMRFNDGMTIGQISHELHYGRSHVYRLYTTALKTLTDKDGTK